MVKFGMGMAPVEPLSKVIHVAKLAEDLGFEYFMNADQRFAGERDAFVSLSAAAMSTSRIKLGTCVSDPFSRIPGMLAVAIASLDELSGGRAVLGLGAGGSGFAQLNLSKEHSNQAIGEAVAMIRGLLSGEVVNFEGKRYKLTDAQLKFAARPDIPIIFASRSPRNLELAGEIADGVLLATYTAHDHLKFAIERVRAGAEKAGRRFEDVKLISWVYTSISDDGKQAVENVRWFVTQALINTSPEAYPVIFKGFPPELPDFLNKCRTEKRNGIEIAYKDRTYLTDEVIKRFSVAGTAEDCIAKIKEITSFGIDTVWLRCFSAPRSQIEHEKVIVPFAEKVMPAFTGGERETATAARAR
jgi:5,10-methylenetetrahydromethanopterin reductase